MLAHGTLSLEGGGFRGASAARRPARRAKSQVGTARNCACPAIGQSGPGQLGLSRARRGSARRGPMPLGGDKHGGSRSGGSCGFAGRPQGGVGQTERNRPRQPCKLPPPTTRARTPPTPGPCRSRPRSRSACCTPPQSPAQQTIPFSPTGPHRCRTPRHAHAHLRSVPTVLAQRLVPPLPLPPAPAAHAKRSERARGLRARVYVVTVQHAFGGEALTVLRRALRRQVPASHALGPGPPAQAPRARARTKASA